LNVKYKVKSESLHIRDIGSVTQP